MTPQQMEARIVRYGETCDPEGGRETRMTLQLILETNRG